MKTRYIWMAVGIAFSVTLAVIVGQRMSAEAMAVMIGVIAGVAASIPTSLIVVWFASRTTIPRPAPEAPIPAPASRPAEAAQPRIVVMAPAQPSPPMGYQNFAGYAAQAYPAYAAPALVQPPQPPRQFTVIGGAGFTLDDPDPSPEVMWQR
jgi:hypothetical protein